MSTKAEWPWHVLFLRVVNHMNKLGCILSCYQAVIISRFHLSCSFMLNFSKYLVLAFPS